VRLAVRFRRPLHEVAEWPAAHVELMQEFLATEPADGDRIEIAIARGIAIYINANRDPKTPAVNPVDFLPYLDPWKAEEKAGRYSDVDASALRAFGVTK
jgi:hypothetical protein